MQREFVEYQKLGVFLYNIQVSWINILYLIIEWWLKGKGNDGGHVYEQNSNQIYIEPFILIISADVKFYFLVY